MTNWIYRHSAALVVGITLFAVLFVVVSDAGAYLHTDWACAEKVSTTGATGEYGTMIQDHRRFGGGAQGQARHMTADNMATRWGGWSAYYIGYYHASRRISNDEIECDIMHHVAWINTATLTRVRVRGADNGLLNGNVWSMIVTDEWDYRASTGAYLGVYRGNDWDACSTDVYC